jgi:hypothetical protein
MPVSNTRERERGSVGAVVSHKRERERGSVGVVVSRKPEKMQMQKREGDCVLILLLTIYSVILTALVLPLHAIIARTEVYSLRAHHLGGTYSQELSLLANLNFFN